MPIILYHRIAVSPDEGTAYKSPYYVEPEIFDQEMKLLRDWGYTTITTELLIKAIKEGADLPPRPILITFDDGHLNNYTTAFPIMQKYGFTGVKREVSQATGKPGLIIEADHTDTRSYAPKQVEKQIQIFLDIVRGKGSS